MGVGGAVGRAIEESAALVGGGEGAAFARDEGIGGEALGQHAVEANERALGVVAAEGVEGVTGAVKGVEAGRAGPEGAAAAGAEHAHAEAAVLFEVMGYPAFLGAAGGEDAAADDVADDEVPVVANAGGGDRVVHGFIGVEGDGNEWGSGDRKSTRLIQSPCNIVCRLLLEKKQRASTRGSDHALPTAVSDPRPTPLPHL